MKKKTNRSHRNKNISLLYNRSPGVVVVALHLFSHLKVENPHSKIKFPMVQWPKMKTFCRWCRITPPPLSTCSWDFLLLKSEHMLHEERVLKGKLVQSLLHNPQGAITQNKIWTEGEGGGRPRPVRWFNCWHKSLNTTKWIDNNINFTSNDGRWRWRRRWRNGVTVEKVIFSRSQKSAVCCRSSNSAPEEKDKSSRSASESRVDVIIFWSTN